MNQYVTIMILVIGALLSSSSYASSDNAHHAHGPHHLSVLLGGTYFEDETTEPTIGVDYEYRVNERLGLGVVVEFAGGGLDAWTYLAVADIHITNDIIIQVGPGIEHTREHDIAVGRLGILYEHSWENLTISPQLHYDYHEGGKNNGIVFGLAFGFAF